MFSLIQIKLILFLDKDFCKNANDFTTSSATTMLKPIHVIKEIVKR